MRILMTADTVGGVWTYAVELAGALAPHGVEVELATMGGPPPERPRGLRLHESGFRLEWMEDPWADVERAGEWLLELADELRPDLVHLNGYAHAALPWGVPVVVAGHSDVVSWFAAVRGEAPPPSFDRYRREVAAGLAAADLVVAPTRWMLGELERGYGLAGPRCVVPNGRRLQVRNSLLLTTEPIVAAAGRLWDEAKNLAALDRAAPRLPWPVVIAGEGGDGATNVTLLGRRPPGDVAALFARASIFCSPARYEPFGLAALEAALAGCALVLGDIPPLREVWGDAATFVPPDDDKALARALRRLIADDALRIGLGTHARTRAAAYAPGRMATAMLAAYESLVPARV